MINNTLKPISSKPITCLTTTNKFSALRHLVGIKFTRSLYCENTLLRIKAKGGASDVMVIVVGNEHGDSSSNPGRE